MSGRQDNSAQYLRRDNEGNKYSHDKSNPKGAKDYEEAHVEVGQYIKSMVYGGLDGTINILVIILSGLSSNQEPSTILAIGVAVTVGDCLGMGLGDYLSLKAENEFIRNEEKREYDQVENRLDDEMQEIIQIYQEKGYTEKQALRIAELYSTNTKAFVNIMMLQELGLVVSDVSEWKCGLVTLLAFLVCGMVPLTPYIISSGILKLSDQQVAASLSIGAFEFFSLGFAKAHIIQATNKKKIYSGIESLIFGAAVVAAGYGIGFAFPEPSR